MFAPIAVLMFVNAAAAVPMSKADRYYSATYSACVDHAGGSDSNFTDCNDAEFRRWDKALNEVYARAMAARTAGGKAALRNQERQWIARTKRRCDHAGDENMGGTAQNVEISSCYLEQTVLRTLELRHGLERR